ncbi:GlsB/YeaQ/YmgE family stress response membrane protein [Jatrophihabitans sp. DSM 45814]
MAIEPVVHISGPVGVSIGSSRHGKQMATGQKGQTIAMWNLLSFILLGLVAGAIARLLVPGRHSLGLILTAVLGMVGSFVGGFIGYLIGHDKGEGGLQVSGIFGSVVGAVIVLAIYQRLNRKKLARR